jgi:hypothetical protein
MHSFVGEGWLLQVAGLRALTELFSVPCWQQRAMLAAHKQIHFFGINGLVTWAKSNPNFFEGSYRAFQRAMLAACHAGSTQADSLLWN